MEGGGNGLHSNLGQSGTCRKGTRSEDAFVCSRKTRYHIVGNFLPSVGLQGKLRQSPGKIFDLDLLDSQQDITCLYTIQQRPLHAPKTKSTDV